MRFLLRASFVCALSVVGASRGVAAGITDGPYWSEIPLPAGFGGPVKAIGTIVSFQAGNDVWFFSAITRSWTVVNTSGFATVAIFNDYATILDGNVVHGYSSRFGVDTLTLASPPVLQSANPTSSWVSVARLGTDIYGFGAFVGKWTHQSVAVPNPTITLAQTTGVIHDGTTAYGFSAYHGTFVPIAAAGATYLSASGDLAAANDGTLLRGFSCHRNTWATHPFNAAVPSTFLRDLFICQSGQDFVAFSGLTGAFSTHHASTLTASVVSDNTVAAIVEGNSVTGYTAAIDGFVTQNFSSPSIAIDDDLFVVVDSAGATGFSGVRGQFSATVPGTFNSVQLKEAVAYITKPNDAYAYSVVQNTWSQALTGQMGAVVLRNVVVGIYPFGYAGFSGRSGTWQFIGSSTPGTFSANASGDIFLGFDGPNIVTCFDPVLERWTAIQTTGSYTFDTWRQTAVLSDGVKAYGIGLMNNAWNEFTLQGSLASLDANDACGYVLTSTHFYAYSGHGSLSSDSRWPEFSRFQPIGSNLPLYQRGTAGSAVVTFAGLAPAEIPAGPVGTFYIDPTVLISFGLGTIPANGLLDVKIPVPALPSLNGIRLHLQNVVSPPAGPVYLTNSIAPVLL